MMIYPRAKLLPFKPNCNAKGYLGAALTGHMQEECMTLFTSHSADMVLIAASSAQLSEPRSAATANTVVRGQRSLYEQ